MPHDRPNILFIYSDQHRYDCVGANGHPLLRTPNIDRLAAEGANFAHAFTPIPMCVPARCSMLTGMWAPAHGVIFNFDGETWRPLDPSLPTSSAAVQAAGYHTIHVGRWHVDPERTPLDFGFHDYVPGWRYLQWRRARGIPPTPKDEGWWGQTDPYPTPEESPLGWAAGQVIDWMERSCQETDPFFIRWHTVEPHYACHPCEPFASMYDPGEIDPWPGFADEFAGKPYVQREMPLARGTGELSWREWAPFVARYFATVSLLDSQIGRVLDALERLGIAEDTLVIYSADHGDMCGSHHMVDKHYVMYDDVVRVPLLMRWPGVIPAGRSVEAFVANAVDFASTFCDAAGAETPDTFAGMSLLPLARGDTDAGREDVLSTYHGNQFGSYSQRMIRDRRWKYVWNATDVDELYDLQTDPAELVNRWRDPAAAGELARLRKRLVWWMKETGDTLANGTILRQIERGLKV